MRFKHKRLIVIILMMLAMASVFCTLPGNGGNDSEYEATLVALQKTETAMAGLPTATLAPTPTPTGTPIPTATVAPAQPSDTPVQTGTISGKLSYPSEWIPAQRVVAFRLESNEYYFVETIDEQSSYQITDLPEGFYQIVSYVIDGDLSAGYTQAVVCGLSVDCTDHSLIIVQVGGGSDIYNIAPVDWYAPDGSFPPDPLK